MVERRIYTPRLLHGFLSDQDRALIGWLVKEITPRGYNLWPTQEDDIKTSIIVKSIKKLKQEMYEVGYDNV